jgi:hypothetical protein
VGNGICLKLSFDLFSVTMDQKFVLYVKKSAENGQFTVKHIKKWSLWAISRKAPYRIFSNMPFWKIFRVPRNTTSLVFLLRSFWKTRPKKLSCHQLEKADSNSTINFLHLLYWHTL